MIAAILIGLGVWLAIFVVFAIAATKEPTAHGKDVLTGFGFLTGFGCMWLVWLVMLLFWLF